MKNCGSATTPATPLAYDNPAVAAGPATLYTQPFYQKGVVPKALALRNEAVNGPVPYRVVPDISMDGDPQTGMLIGATQTFPRGVRYGQFKEGGTSLSSPLLAGVIADAVQAAGTPLGFLNPVLYKAYKATPAAFDDTRLPPHPHSAAVIRVDFANAVNASSGYVVSAQAAELRGAGDLLRRDGQLRDAQRVADHRTRLRQHDRDGIDQLQVRSHDLEVLIARAVGGAGSPAPPAAGQNTVMATYSVNPDAVARAHQLIDRRQYVLDSDWGEVQPGAAAQNAYLEAHSWDEYARWHLGLTDGAADHTKARYAFVYGDFRRVHRMGIIACHYRAAQWRHKEIELAAHDLLQYLDNKSS